MLKLQKSGKSENSNIVTEEVKKTELSANEDKRVQSIRKICTWNEQRSSMKRKKLNLSI